MLSRICRSVDISVRVLRNDDGHALDRRIHNDLARKTRATPERTRQKQRAQRTTNNTTDEESSKSRGANNAPRRLCCPRGFVCRCVNELCRLVLDPLGEVLLALALGRQSGHMRVVHIHVAAAAHGTVAELLSAWKEQQHTPEHSETKRRRAEPLTRRKPAFARRTESTAVAHACEHKRHNENRPE